VRLLLHPRNGSTTVDLIENGLDGSRPDEWLRIGIVGIDVAPGVPIARVAFAPALGPRTSRVTGSFYSVKRRAGGEYEPLPALPAGASCPTTNTKVTPYRGNIPEPALGSRGPVYVVHGVSKLTANYFVNDNTIVLDGPCADWLGKADHRPPARPSHRPRLIGRDGQKPGPGARPGAEPGNGTPGVHCRFLDGVLGRRRIVKHGGGEPVAGADVRANHELEAGGVARPSARQ
jgi:hypothetical protein